MCRKRRRKIDFFCCFYDCQVPENYKQVQFLTRTWCYFRSWNYNEQLAQGRLSKTEVDQVLANLNKQIGCTLTPVIWENIIFWSYMILAWGYSYLIYRPYVSSLEEGEEVNPIAYIPYIFMFILVITMLICLFDFSDYMGDRARNMYEKFFAEINRSTYHARRIQWRIRWERKLQFISIQFQDDNMTMQQLQWVNGVPTQGMTTVGGGQVLPQEQVKLPVGEPVEGLTISQNTQD